MLLDLAKIYRYPPHIALIYKYNSAICHTICANAVEYLRQFMHFSPTGKGVLYID